MAADAPGVTDDTITLGVVTINGYGEAAAALGIPIASGDQQKQALVITEYLNSQGGGAGRTYELVFYDSQIGTDAETNAQAACAAFTEDAHVFAVVNITSLGDNFYSCMRDHGVPVVTAGDQADAGFYAEFPNVYQPMDVNMTRLGGVYATGLHAEHFFDGGWERAGSTETRVGLLRTDDPRHERANEEGLKPALSSLGFEVASEFVYSSTGQDANAVLQFRADAITHVFFLGGSPLLFSQTAEQQGYRPRYALTSRMSMGALLQTTMTAEQLNGAMGIGYNQLNDVDTNHDPGPPNDRAVTCDQLMRDNGEQMDNRVTQIAAMWTCDMFFFVDDTVEQSTELGPSGFQAAVESMGTSYPSVTTFRTEHGPGLSHDGVAAWRLTSYLTDCSCFDYTSDLRSLPH